MKWYENVIKYLIYLYIIVLPIFPSNFKYKKFTFNGDIILAIIIIIYIISFIFISSKRKKVFRCIKDIFSNYLMIFIFLWIFLLWVSVSYASDKRIALNETIRFTSYVILFFIIKYELNYDNILNTIIKVYVSVSSVVGVIGVYQYLYGKELIQQFTSYSRIRVDSTLENSNNLGMYFIILIFPMIFLAINTKEKCKKVVFFLVSILAAVNIILSGSRNAWLGLVIGLAIMTIFYSYKLFMLYIASGAICIFIPAISNRIKQFTDQSQNLSRIKIWSVAFSIIKEHPLLGVGSGNFPKYFADYCKKFNNISEYVGDNKTHPHNIILKAQAELGILGSISFAGILVTAILRVKKAYKSLNDEFFSKFFKGYFVSLVVFVFMNMIDNFLTAPKVIAFFWILLAVSESLLYNRENNISAK